MASEEARRSVDSHHPTLSTPQSQDPEKSSENDAKVEKVEEETYPSGLKLLIIMAALLSAVFLVSLDRMIIATAIPKITDDFHSADDIGWYSTAFQLTACSFQLLYGKLYTTMNVKGVFLTSLAIFEIGSAICGAAPNSIAFIIGRAIAGTGTGGLVSGSMSLIVYTVPLHKRPMYQGFFGAISGVASAAGPLFGGIFTSKATWRWCFYINLPLGALVGMGVMFFLQVPKAPEMSLRDKLAQLDFYGTGLILPGVVCLVLGLEWGGTTYAWNNGRIIALFVISPLLLIAFGLVQGIKHDGVQSEANNEFLVFYIPVWLQAIRGLSAVQSGIQTLPMLLPMFGASLVGGILIRRIGYYTPFSILGDAVASVGAGFIYTLTADSSKSQYLGYQSIYGIGLGLSFMAPNIAAQTVLPKRDVPIGIGLIFFSQLIAPSILVPVAQTVLNTQLQKQLSGLPGLDKFSLADGGVTSIVDLSPSVRPQVIRGYAKALQHVFMVGLIVTCISIFGSLALEWKNTREQLNEKKKLADSNAPNEEVEAKLSISGGQEKH
ncbi:MFS transporter, DHA2 family, glioxin efflux transporter [Geosmithia morbida]|uniref:MFS transporter, DHA2 family, glioxin efflux transporter n=1 Tax=Geosmithia morbida TaxID=1094350 RepID=A0A9P5D0Z1_9HYPO|nr:MFS transporter, DHA2 family, glioxin efflux transporter [Geosmithia morbida]KAF4122162.1 MFS transporter, DHA2 family, glioxin efflux transporter [Geosmithia morbida]